MSCSNHCGRIPAAAVAPRCRAGWRLTLTLLVALLCHGANAFPAIYNIWNDTYPEATADDALVAAVGTPCQVCHVSAGGGEPWNAYGYAVLQNGGFANLPQAFLDIENEDADGEGTANLAEIRAGTLPGWCEPATAGCQNLGWTRAGVSSPATPPAGVTLDPPPTQPPVADPGGPYAAVAGLRLRFDANASFDNDGTVASWDWKFGDGGAGSGVSPAYAYATPGTYTVVLKITDNDGLTAIATTVVVVAPRDVPQAPVADAGGPYTGTEGVAVSFNGAGSFDPDGVIVSYAWDFGDRSGATGVNPTHTYGVAGDFVVSLTVTDNDGQSAVATTSASISEALGPGETLFRSVCLACHGEPFVGPAIDPGLVAGRRNTGARTCSIDGAINGNAVFVGGVPEMRFLQGVYTSVQIQAVSDYLNSQLPISGQRRFVTTCAGCHGNDASGGRVNEDIRGRDADRIYRALGEVPQMAFLNCLPDADIQAIGSYLETLDDD